MPRSQSQPFEPRRLYNRTLRLCNRPIRLFLAIEHQEIKLLQIHRPVCYHGKEKLVRLMKTQVLDGVTYFGRWIKPMEDPNASTVYACRLPGNGPELILVRRPSTPHWHAGRCHGRAQRANFTHALTRRHASLSAHWGCSAAWGGRQLSQPPRGGHSGAEQDHPRPPLRPAECG